MKLTLLQEKTEASDEENPEHSYCSLGSQLAKTDKLSCVPIHINTFYTLPMPIILDNIII